MFHYAPSLPAPVSILLGSAVQMGLGYMWYGPLFGQEVQKQQLLERKKVLHEVSGTDCAADGVMFSASTIREPATQ